MNIRTIPLRPSSVTNGRVYFEAVDHIFFPADSFGDREDGGIRGRPVKFTAGAQTYECDIRRAARDSSNTQLSPRSSFAKFLGSVGAVPEGNLRFTRKADREYLVEYVAPAAA